MPAAPIHHAIGNAQQLGQQVKFEVMMFFKQLRTKMEILGFHNLVNVRLVIYWIMFCPIINTVRLYELWFLLKVSIENQGVAFVSFSIGSMNTNGRFSQEGTQHFSTKWVELIGAIGLETSLLYPQAIMWRWAVGNAFRVSLLVLGCPRNLVRG